jgi:hypothetical protein
MSTVTQPHSDSNLAAPGDIVSWVHFGDLHITTREHGTSGKQLGPNKNGRKW